MRLKRKKDRNALHMGHSSPPGHFGSGLLAACFLDWMICINCIGNVYLRLDSRLLALLAAAEPGTAIPPVSFAHASVLCVMDC